MNENGKLSQFSISSYGVDAVGEQQSSRIADPKLNEAKLLELISRVANLSAKMDELYMRPPMEHSDPAWEGYRLYWDIFVADKPAPYHPRWGLGFPPNPITSDTFKELTDTDKTIGTRKDKTISKRIIKTKQPYININRTKYVTTGGSTVSTTTDTTTSYTTVTGLTLTTTATNTIYANGTVEKGKVWHYGTLGWITTDTYEQTIWPDEFEPGTYTNLDTTTETVTPEPTTVINITTVTV
jgi:hypothetical protein